jgi:hypothetical protein
MTVDLASSLHDFARWRATLVRQIAAYQQWLEKENLGDPQSEARLAELGAALQDDKLIVAFVAEFSRGKSELINAIFFGDYGRRVLPSASGRTTMCPTEVLWDSSVEPCLRLLPIETRTEHAPLSEFRKLPAEWRTVPFDPTSGPSMAEAMQTLRETRQVPLSEARKLSLWCDPPASGDEAEPETLVSIPRWRHAIVNFPHPLLQQGLVVLDTPGFNVIGAEPELALELLPAAHGILYVLALDTGVTKSDLAVWREAVALSGVRDQLRYAVLNKIDTIWDGLRTEEEIEAEILHQRTRCAEVLGIDAARIFPVSAQKGLLGKITSDETLLDRSRLPLLEQAISGNLLPQRRLVLGQLALERLTELMNRTKLRLETRQRGVHEQLVELLALHGKNTDIVSHLMRQALREKQSLEQSLVKYQAMRRRYSTFTNDLLVQLGVDALAQQTRRMIDAALASQFKFTSTLRAAMQTYLDDCHERLERASGLLRDLQKLVAIIYQKFEHEHGLRLGTPAPFSLLRHERELERLEHIFEVKFKSLRALLGSDDRTLLHRFIQTIVTRVYEVFGTANSSIDSWLRAIMAPVEVQIRESEQQLRRRMESIRRIRSASGAIDARIAELKAAESELNGKISEVISMAADLGKAIDDGPIEIAAAA